MAERTLFIIEGEGSGINLTAAESAFFDLACKDELRVLWMSEILCPDSLLEQAEKNQKVSIVAAGELIQDQLQDKFNAELQDWFVDINKKFVDVSDWWLSHLSELNFMHPAWATLVRFNIIYDQLQAGQFTKCIVWGEDHLTHLCQMFCDEHSISFSGNVVYARGKSLFSEILFAYARWVSNFLSEFLAYILTRSHNKRSILADRCVYVQYPRNWRHSKTHAFYRFIGRLSQTDQLSSRSFAYLVSLTRKDTLRLKKVKSIWQDFQAMKREMTNFPFIFVEGCASVGQIFRSYLNLNGCLYWWKTWWQLRQSGQIVWRGVDISLLLRASLINTPLVDWPKNRHLERCTHSALDKGAASELLLPIYELAEGRAVARAANQAGLKTLGLQHNSYSLGHRWRVITAMGVMAEISACEEAALPDRITAEGPLSRDWWSQTDFPLERIVEIGAPRITKLIPEPDLTKASRNILVLGEYHRPQLLFDWCVDNLLELGFEITLRPHPTFYEKGHTWLHSQPESVRQIIQFSPQGMTLEQDLDRMQPLCILASITGASVDVAYSGWPVGIVISNWVVNNSPLAAIGDSPLMMSNDPERIIAWIDRLSADRDFRREYSRACIEAAHQHYQITGLEAASNLAALINTK